MSQSGVARCSVLPSATPETISMTDTDSPTSTEMMLPGQDGHREHGGDEQRTPMDPFPLPGRAEARPGSHQPHPAVRPSRDALLAGASAGSIAIYEGRRTASPHARKGAH
ncbi:hypothetical protein GCM10009733_087430 [Nonomuraea maheshkhaliensis]|uniref:Uncharacterized protein n=1 Tax=Nonomuraea maheshkhaliensis TaxID=419590 RepID=A0ABP4SRH0_9ACTN